VRKNQPKDHELADLMDKSEVFRNLSSEIETLRCTMLDEDYKLR
jgi:hypothetical protein